MFQVLFADVQGFFVNLFLGAAACVAVWMYLLNKIGAGGVAKDAAKKGVINFIQRLMK
jgi:hypothetical protein